MGRGIGKAEARIGGAEARQMQGIGKAEARQGQARSTAWARQRQGRGKADARQKRGRGSAEARQRQRKLQICIGILRFSETGRALGECCPSAASVLPRCWPSAVLAEPAELLNLPLEYLETGGGRI